MSFLCSPPLFFFGTLLVTVLLGSPVFCAASNLRRATSPSSFASEKSITVSDSDLVGTRSFLVVELEGYVGDVSNKMSSKKHAILDCAFRQAFNEVHGDRDGLYLSGQQIVATDRAAMEDSDETDEDEETDLPDHDAPSQAPRTVVELRHKPYVRRPRNYSKKARERPPYPPPRPPPRTIPLPKETWNIYLYADMSGRCNMCPDDDSMEATSLLLNTNNDETETEQTNFDNINNNYYRKAHDQAIASDFVTSEASVNSIADAMRAKLIEGTCADKGDTDHFFEYVRDTDIFVLSEAEFEASVAAIAASREATLVGQSSSSSSSSSSASSSAANDNLEFSNSTGSLLPFYFGEFALTRGNVGTNVKSRLEMIKIGMSGVACGPWDNEALLDMNSGLHDSINSLGFTDKGHVVDKIIKRRRQPRYQRRYIWKCHYDVYAKVDVDGGDLDEPSLNNIGDALCDDMVRNSGSNKFRNVIDCQLQVVGTAEYESIAAINDEAGVVVSSSARE